MVSWLLDWKVDCIYGRIVGGLDIVCFLVGWLVGLIVCMLLVVVWSVGLLVSSCGVS